MISQVQWQFFDWPELIDLIGQLEPLEITLALLGVVVAVIGFLYPEGRKRLRTFFRRLFANRLLRNTLILTITALLGFAAGYWQFHMPTENTLAKIRARENGQGLLFCGVSGDVPGFSELDEDGIWKGMDVDYCRALAAATLGDANKVSYVRLNAGERFSALTEGKVDVLFRNTSWTVGRALGWNVAFGPPIFVDSQVILTHADSTITTYDDLEGKKLCILRTTTSYANLKSFLSEHNIDAEIVTGYPNEVEFENNSAVFDAYLGAMASTPERRTCNAMSTDRSQVFTQLYDRGISYDPEAGFADHHIIEGEPVSPELLSPVFRSGDQQWANIVTYGVWATIYAEKLGVTSKNVNRYNSSSPLRFRQLLGIDALTNAPDDEQIDQHIGELLGLDPAFAQRIIRDVGNYQEIYEHNVGPIFGTDRKANQIWRQDNGGSFNPPPFTTGKF